MRIFIFVLFILISKLNFSQSAAACEKIYDTPDSLAHYGKDKKDLRNYFQDKIMPILADCIKKKIEFVYKITIKFTIDAQGKVIAVDFLEPVLSDYCSGKLREEMLTMKAWNPGKKGEQNVCSVFIYPVAGIKWQ